MDQNKQNFPISTGTKTHKFRSGRLFCVMKAKISLRTNWDKAIKCIYKIIVFDGEKLLKLFIGNFQNGEFEFQNFDFSSFDLNHIFTF